MYLGAAALAVAGAVGYKMWSSPEPLAVRMDPNNRSVILEDGSRIAAVGGDREDYRVEGVHTLYDAFRRGHKLSKHEKCLGERTGPNKEYEWLTYDEVLARAENLASGLIHLGLSPGGRLGIYSTNNSKWVITEQGCNTQSLVLVPLYDSHGREACQHIVNLTELRIIVCDSAERSRSLIAQSADLPTLSAVIVMAPLDDNLRREAAEHKITVYGFEEVEILGQNNPHEATPPKSSDVATICFTSGTTGVPKGAMLSHGNIVTNASSLCVPDYFGRVLVTDECHFSYLPLAHMYERTVQAMMFLYGCRIGFFGGDMKLLLDDIQALKPTIFAAVPRILNKIYDKVQAGVRDSRIKKYLLDVAIRKKDAQIKQRIIRKDSIWDKLVLGKIQALLGGNVRMMTCGSAPLSAEVLRFTRAAFGCLVMEGYGQTEATAGITFQFAGDFETGHVGGPLACNRVKLIDVPEMGYSAADGKGEICAKGGNVFVGYYKEPEKTAQSLDDEGWLHTGDIGQWLPNGALKVIDRKKNVYKLSQGEYIAPEKVENVYMRSQFVAQAFVDGDSLKSRSMAVIVPDPDTLLPWARTRHLPQDMAALCKDQSVKSAVMTDIEEHGRAAGLTTLEQVKDIYLFPEPFSLENGLTTPTFKNRRDKLRKFFVSEFTEMYTNANE